MGRYSLARLTGTASAALRFGFPGTVSAGLAREGQESFGWI
jgi:hypothetical protein